MTESSSRNDSVASVKSGWLYRQDRLLFCIKRWRRVWFVMDRDCTLRYFRRPENSVADGLLVLRRPYALIDPEQMGDVQPPQGLTKECLLRIVTSDAKMTLCGDTPQDIRDWKCLMQGIHEPCTRPPQQVIVLTPVIYCQAIPVYGQSSDVIVISSGSTVQSTAPQMIHGGSTRPVALAPIVLR